MKISIVAAMAENRVIGKNNKLPWHIPEDLKRFKELTFLNPVIMGRKTYQSIGKGLYGRWNIVMTNQADFRAFDCFSVKSVAEAVEVAELFGKENVFVIGGAEIYKQFLPIAQKIYLTLIYKEYEGDTYFPDLDYGQWQEIERVDGNCEKSQLEYSFITLARKQNPA